jgi:vacuolar-type H+-ATPase subunit E/Vma4
MEMKREVAETIMKAMKEVEFAVNRLDEAIRAIENEEERKTMLRFLANVIHEFHVKINLPVVQHFPDLHPDVPGSRDY